MGPYLFYNKSCGNMEETKITLLGGVKFDFDYLVDFNSKMVDMSSYLAKSVCQ